MSVWAILVAAGRGERLGMDRPKAFARLRGRPLLAESLERLDDSEWVDAIVVAAPSGWEEPSTLLAIAAVPEDAAVVLVHDAARPLLPGEVVERVLAPLSEGWDGVVPALPIPDTVKRVERDAVVETLDREGLVAVQTPQAFVATVLRAALAGDVSAASDCASLVERAGGRVRVVPGDPRLLKVTEAADLERVERLLAEP